MNLNFGLDPQQQLAFDSESSCAVLANDTGAHILVDLDHQDEALVLRARTQNFFYAGVIGLTHGEVGIRAESGCLATVMGALPDFLSWLQCKLNSTVAEDSGSARDVAELERLWSLQDKRTEN